MKKLIMPTAHYEVAEIQLSYKLKVKRSDRPKVGHAHDAYKILKQCWDADKIDFIEEFKILLLDTNNNVIGIFEVSSGGTSTTTADPRLIFAAALKANAKGIILAHNHPSGDWMPSHNDKAMTRLLVEAGALLMIPVLDHVIVTREGYYSFANEGLL
ncbi:JAB domain-containing protein [Mucilaginibacter paludis]|uniref:DNA repair protein RadC n=1 Tax=Mucilaginibacter paludis DSM 18603 TaxID=714943 RepID=H1YBW9_9SPHI|nr:JAB domain-containing protein [Mucilaginibacter paludis]EHQ27047.1 DNA repair protein RadC [Mucilaginibacter paludis DSM 18603]